ncbi:unnamed protein product [Cyprideis torosa]|uniref:Uncharacterized protein n=1 Tax=Cyprideis torosa TaxID=163714 RepID=A0A7R8W7S4_9CRUS|nr:unnamed protein product [Cyprideis torosa]CAG0887870.1 unnamed protein product [Cyprideis torosa]
MNVEFLEKEARASAIKQVENLLQRSDQLEKVDEYKRRYSRKKASVESMLKTALQSQLDGVKYGLVQLQSSLQDIQEIKKNLQEVDRSLVSLPELSARLSDLKVEQMRHSQFVTARENLKNIFTVPETIEKALQYISEGKMLNAHQVITKTYCLQDLENSRDDLLFELHRNPSQSGEGRQLLERYFAGVLKPSEEFMKQLWVVFKRLLNTVRKEPKVVVTALRIVEREEKSDSFCQQRRDSTGFMPPGRPKQLRARALKVLEESVAERIEGQQIQNRDEEKMWLVVHLELLRKMLIEDLKVVKTLCIPVFPPYWNIIKTFTRMYHECLGRHLSVVISNEIVGNEHITLLEWILNAYPQILNQTDVHTADLGPLVDPTVIDKLKLDYVNFVQQNFSLWLPNTLTGCLKEWTSASPPQVDGQGYYRTQLPLLLQEMLKQNIDVSATISADVQLRVVDLCATAMIDWHLEYRNKMVAFKNLYFQDRNAFRFYTYYMIANINDCATLADFAVQMRREYGRPEPDAHGLKLDVKGKLERMERTFRTLRDDACAMLLEEVFVDLEPHFQEIFAKEWLENTLTWTKTLRDDACAMLLEEVFVDLEPHFQEIFAKEWLENTLTVDVITETLRDYFADYSKLFSKNYDFVCKLAMNTVVQKYLTQMLTKRFSFRTSEERLKGAMKVKDEGQRIKLIFTQTIHATIEGEDPFSAIYAVGELLSIQDVEFLPLEMHSMTKQFPDITHSIMVAILALRGDISRSEAKEKVQEVMKSNEESGRRTTARTIFSRVKIPDRFLDQLFSKQSA